MKDRFVTLLGALAALYIVIAIFINPQMSARDENSKPLTTDQGKNGLMAMYTWLERSGVPVERLQRRYGDLDKIKSLPRKGNLLVVSTPQVTPAREQDVDELMDWIKRGNNVLLLSASSDGILNKGQNAYGGAGLLGRLGFSLYYKSKEKEENGEDKEDEDDKKSLKEVAEDLDKTIDAELVPIGKMPIMAGVGRLHGKLSKLSPAEYTLAPSSGYRSVLSLARDRATRVPALWEVRYWGSRIWVSRFGYLFSNDQLDEADNARLAANIVRSALGPGGRVIFDDMHQGQTELYDEKAFYEDPRLHNTLWFIFAFWVLYVVGHTNRIAPVSSVPRPARVVDFVEAMANLFARRLTPVASARLLFSHFFDWIRLRYSMPTNGEPVWPLLETTERLDKQDVAELKKNFADLENNKKVNLLKLVNRMQKIRSALS